MSDCPRLGKLFGGCKFSPRYDLGPPVTAGVKVSGYDIATYLEATKPKTYVRDVCERCGKTVPRGEPADA